MTSEEPPERTPLRSYTSRMDLYRATPPYMRALLFGDGLAQRPGGIAAIPRSVSVPLLPHAAQGFGELPSAPNPFWYLEICPVRGIGSAAAGYVMGFLFGTFFSGMGSPPPLPPPPGVDAPKVPLLRQVKDGLLDMRAKGVSTAKSFGIVGGVYATIECYLENYRGKKDMTNAALSGLCTGAVIAARAGPRAMLVSGAGFTAFSIVVELVSPYIFD